MNAAAPVDTAPSLRRWSAVLWPAFLMAGVLEIVVFAHVDPAALHDIHGAPFEVSATAVYSIAFLVFWALMAISAAITQGLDRSAADVNKAAS